MIAGVVRGVVNSCGSLQRVTYPPSQGKMVSS